MRVSVAKIIKSDLLSTLCLIAPIVTIALFIDSEYFGFLGQYFSRGRSVGPSDSSTFLTMAIVAICVSVPLLLFRVKNIQNHFKDGIEVVGKIVYLSLWKDRGRVEYEYEINGEKYRSGNALHRNKFVNSLKEGQEISIIVSKNNHSKGLIRELYEV